MDEDRRRRAEGRLARAARRLGIAPRSVKVRAADGSGSGVTLDLPVLGVAVRRTCDVAEDRTGNVEALAGWLVDLVRNLERRIETLDEAFFADGLELLPDGADPFASLAHNAYRGSMSVERARRKVARALERMGLRMEDVDVSWDAAANVARIRMRLPSGRVVKKESHRQDTWERNLAALVLWLEARARSVERGIERDLERLFAANLLPMKA